MDVALVQQMICTVHCAAQMFRVHGGGTHDHAGASVRALVSAGALGHPCTRPRIVVIV